jgi:hypothetical protein
MAAPSTKKTTRKSAAAPKELNGSAEAVGAAVKAPAGKASSAEAAKPKATRAKRATPPKAAPVNIAVESKSKRAKKEKVVRDSFTMPKSDYAKLAELKQKCLEAGVAVKKSELLRAGLLLLAAAPADKLLEVIAAVETVKTGRPAKPAQQEAAQ